MGKYTAMLCREEALRTPIYQQSSAGPLNSKIWRGSPAFPPAVFTVLNVGDWLAAVAIVETVQVIAGIKSTEFC